MMKRTKRNTLIGGAFAVLFTLASASTTLAQQPVQQAPAQTQALKEDFQEEELDCFLNASSKINEIQMEAQGEMMKIVEDEGLSVEKFNAIAQAQQVPDSSATQSDPKEVEAFQKAAEKITGMQQTVEGKMVEAVEAEGLEVETYMQIAQAYQQSPKVKGELDEKMKQKQASQQDSLNAN